MKIVLQQRTGEASPPDMLIDMPEDSTVHLLKARINELHLAHPPPEFQKLIYGGRLLVDDQAKLADILHAVSSLFFTRLIQSYVLVFVHVGGG